VEFYVDSTIQFFLNGLGNLSALADGQDIFDPIHYGPFQPNNDSVNTSYLNGWHVIYIARDRSTYSTTLLDFVRFFSNGQIQQSSNNVDSLYYKHEWSYSALDTTVSHSNYDGAVDFAIIGLQTTQATFAGSNDLTINTKFASVDSTVWRDFTISADLSNFVVKKTGSGWAQGCPSSGTISATVTMTYTKDTGTPVTTTWTFDLSFTNGTMTATAQLGNTTWDYTNNFCTAPN
ncbi:MAG: hypothetical protein ACE5D6_02465, partial [Candidatus Zixiibacteriota bacterium]